MHITAACRIGCVRSHNEDMVLVGSHFVRDEEIRLEEVSLDDTDRYLIAVADGMGGHKSGEVASSEVLHHLQYYFGDIPARMTTTEYNEKMIDWLESINIIIDAKGKANENYKGMGTTLVAFVYYNGKFLWMNSGDSRLYRLREGKISLLTTDHSLNALLGDHKHNHVITNCIGGGCKSSYMDIKEVQGGVQTGDRFLLCSDGLNDMLSDEKIEKLLNGNCHANGLCNAAILAGGFDNVSTCIIDIID